MAQIMISYRREDSAGWARSLCDRLTARFGHEQVFIDVDTIRPGENFIKAIERALEGCDVMLVVIGPRWLTVTDVQGQRRLFGERDYVRLEIEAALHRDVPVIPVLVDDARMPESHDLPPAIAGLAFRNAYALDVVGFSRDVEELTEDLEHRLGQPTGTVKKFDLSAVRRILRRLAAAPGASISRLARVSRWRLVVGVLVVATLGVGAVVWRFRPRPPYVVAAIPAGDGPVGIAVVADGIWVSHQEDGTLRRIDARTNRSDIVVPDLKSVPLGDLVSGFGSLWVARQNGAVVRVDPARPAVLAEISLPSGPVDLAVDDEHVWVSGVDGTVGRIEPATNRFEKIEALKMSPGFAVADIEADAEVASQCTSERVWVAHRGPDDNYVRALDPEGPRGRNLNENHGVGRSPIGIAAGFGSLWVTNSGDETVSRIDPCSDHFRRVTVGASPWGLTVGHDAVWIANKTDGTVSRVDPDKNTTTDTLKVGPGPDGIAVSNDGDVWVASSGDDQVWRIDPGRRR